MWIVVRLVAVLLHLSFRFDEYWTIFGAVVGVIDMVHAVWKLEQPHPWLDVPPLWLYWFALLSKVL
jgi:hypothetical protein